MVTEVLHRREPGVIGEAKMTQRRDEKRAQCVLAKIMKRGVAFASSFVNFVAQLLAKMKATVLTKLAWLMQGDDVTGGQSQGWQHSMETRWLLDQHGCCWCQVGQADRSRDTPSCQGQGRCRNSYTPYQKYFCNCKFNFQLLNNCILIKLNYLAWH